MAEIVNLRQARKARARLKTRAEGDENAARSGRTPAQKRAEAQATEKARATLEAHRRDDGTAAPEVPAVPEE